MCVENKLSNTCGVMGYARCLWYDAALPEISQLSECATVEDTIKELYGFVDKHAAALDTTDLNDYCNIIETNEEGEITQREVNVAVLKKLCELTESLEGITGEGSLDMSKIDMSKCELSLTGLTDLCGEEITSFCQLIQTLVDKTISQQESIDSLTTSLETLQSTVDTISSNLTTALADITTLQSYHA